MDFIGRDALMKQRDEGVKRMYVQLILQDHDIEVDMWPWGSEPIYRDGKYVGATTTTGYGFTFKKQASNKNYELCWCFSWSQKTLIFSWTQTSPQILKLSNILLMVGGGGHHQTFFSKWSGFHFKACFAVIFQNKHYI